MTSRAQIYKPTGGVERSPLPEAGENTQTRSIDLPIRQVAAEAAEAQTRQPAAQQGGARQETAAQGPPALPQVMRTRLAANAQVASIALPTIPRSAVARKHKFDAALGSAATQLQRFSLLWGWWYGRWLQPRCVHNHLGRR